MPPAAHFRNIGGIYQLLCCGVDGNRGTGAAGAIRRMWSHAEYRALTIFYREQHGDSDETINYIRE
jgi:hypothetical protein